jgi:hypothetical protein
MVLTPVMLSRQLARRSCAACRGQGCACLWRGTGHQRRACTSRSQPQEHKLLLRHAEHYSTLCRPERFQATARDLLVRQITLGVCYLLAAVRTAECYALTAPLYTAVWCLITGCRHKPRCCCCHSCWWLALTCPPRWAWSSQTPGGGCWTQQWAPCSTQHTTTTAAPQHQSRGSESHMGVSTCVCWSLSCHANPACTIIDVPCNI